MVHFRLDAEYVSDQDEGGEEQRDPSESREQDGDHDGDSEEGGEATESPLYGLYERVSGVKKDLKWLVEMQNTHRMVEAKFREMAEVTNFRVILWAVIQLSILVITGWFQMQSLKSFFIAKKLV